MTALAVCAPGPALLVVLCALAGWARRGRWTRGGGALWVGDSPGTRGVGG